MNSSTVTSENIDILEMSRLFKWDARSVGFRCLFESKGGQYLRKCLDVGFWGWGNPQLVWGSTWVCFEIFRVVFLKLIKSGQTPQIYLKNPRFNIEKPQSDFLSILISTPQIYLKNPQLFIVWEAWVRGRVKNF